MTEGAGGSAGPQLHRYAVITSGSVWCILTPQRRFGLFQSRASAWAVAVGLAREAEAAGRAVELLMQGDDGDFTMRAVYRSPRPRLAS